MTITNSHVTELTNDRQAHRLVPTVLSVFCLHPIAATITGGQVGEDNLVNMVFIRRLGYVHTRIMWLEMVEGEEGREKRKREEERGRESKGERKGEGMFSCAGATAGCYLTIGTATPLSSICSLTVARG